MKQDILKKMENKIKEEIFKKQKECCRCKEESLMQVMLPISEVTETGKVIFPNETKEMSVQIPVPLCFKCMQFAQEGFINVIKVPNSDKFKLTQICDDNGNWSLEFFEDRYNKGELKKDIEESLQKEKLTRKQVKKQKLRSALKIGIIVDEVMDNFEKFKKEVKKKEVRNSSNA